MIKSFADSRKTSQDAADAISAGARNGSGESQAHARRKRTPPVRVTKCARRAEPSVDAHCANSSRTEDRPAFGPSRTGIRPTARRQRSRDGCEEDRKARSGAGARLRLHEMPKPREHAHPNRFRRRYPDAEIMFVGEAPGADEDAQGEPFVGRAGQLLTKIIKAMGFGREEVYIANILKCRPDVPAGSFGNRAPTPREMQTCRPYLMEQIDIIKPKVIVALGAVAVEGLLGTRAPMRELRGRWESFDGTPLMITYHPAYLLRNQSPSEKRKVWEDMMLVLERLEKPVSEKQRNYFL